MQDAEEAEFRAETFGGSGEQGLGGPQPIDHQHCSCVINSLVSVLVVFDRFPLVLAKDEEETKNEGSLIHIYHRSHGYQARGAPGARVVSGPAALAVWSHREAGACPLGMSHTGFRAPP